MKALGLTCLLCALCGIIIGQDAVIVRMVIAHADAMHECTLALSEQRRCCASAIEDYGPNGVWKVTCSDGVCRSEYVGEQDGVLR